MLPGAKAKTQRDRETESKIGKEGRPDQALETR